MSENKTAIERIPEQVRKVFEENVIEIVDGWETNNDETLVYELESYTDHGGDMIHTMTVNKAHQGSLGEWARAFGKVCEDFDPWHEAHLWMGEDGTPGESAPFSDGGCLLEDITDYKKHTLIATLNELEDLVSYPEINPSKFADRIPLAISLAFERSEMSIADVASSKYGQDEFYDITLTALVSDDEEATHRMSIARYALDDYESWAHAFYNGVWATWKPQNDDEAAYKANTLSVINDNLSFLDSLNFTHLLA